MVINVITSNTNTEMLTDVDAYVNVRLDYVHLWEGVVLFELQCISLNVSLYPSQSLLTAHTVGSLTGAA